MDNQRLELSAYISHQQPDHPGTQGSPSLPASHTPSPLDPLKVYVVLTGGRWGILSILSCVAVFTQGKLQSPKKIYALTIEEEEEKEEEEEEKEEEEEEESGKPSKLDKNVFR